MLRQTETDRQRDSFGLGNNYTYIQYIQTTTKQQQKVVRWGRGHKYLKNYYVYRHAYAYTDCTRKKAH